jgi:cytoskeletal protein CcmA (bactofilin family)
MRRGVPRQYPPVNKAQAAKICPGITGIYREGTPLLVHPLRLCSVHPGLFPYSVLRGFPKTNRVLENLILLSFILKKDYSVKPPRCLTKNVLLKRPLNRGYIGHIMTDVHNDVMEDEDFDTVLSPDIDFSGKIRFEKPFLIKGKVSGEITAEGLLVIDEGAVVEANIFAAKVIIRGTVVGNVTAAEKVEVALTGKLTGNVTAPEVFMETGCIFNGRCTMTERQAVDQGGISKT